MMDKQNMMDQANVVQLYSQLSENKNLMMLLKDMQIQNGISAEKAEENAKALVHMVSAREILVDDVSTDRNAALEGILKKFARMKDEKQKEMLHRLYFGLSLYQDPELSGKVQDGVSAEWLFQAYYDRCGSDPEMTVEVLEQRIRALVADFYLSPQAIRAFAGRAKHGDVLAASAALSEEGRNFKCVAAMDLYLSHQDTMTLEEAVTTACTDVEIQAAADACSCGLLTEDQVKVLMAIASLVCVFLAACWFSDILSLNGKFFDEELVSELTSDELKKLKEQFGKTVIKFGIAIGINFGLDATVSNVSRWCGKLATKQRFICSREESRVAQTLNTVADHVQIQKEAAAGRDDRERHEHRLEEARRQAFEQEQEMEAKVRRMQTFR